MGLFGLFVFLDCFVWFASMFLRVVLTRSWKSKGRPSSVEIRWEPIRS